MRGAAALLALVLVAGTVHERQAQANPAIILARVAQIASKVAQVGRAVGRISRISKLGRIGTRAMMRMERIGSRMGEIGRITRNFRTMMRERQFNVFKKMSSDRFSGLKRMMRERSGLNQLRAFQEKALVHRDLMRTAMNDMSTGNKSMDRMMQRMQERLRNRRMNASRQNNMQQEQDQRRRMMGLDSATSSLSKLAERRPMFQPQGGMFATSLAHGGAFH